jgi:hypothetical protein
MLAARFGLVSLLGEIPFEPVRRARLIGDLAFTGQDVRRVHIARAAERGRDI